MTNRIFRGILAAVALSAMAWSILFFWVLAGAMQKEANRRLNNEMTVLVQTIQNFAVEPETLLKTIKLNDTRITLIEPSGRVIYDTAVRSDVMDNHFNRPEIQAAIQTGTGTSERFSDTLGTKTYYKAVLLSDGMIVRLALTQKTVLGQAYAMIVPLLLIFAGVILLAAQIARKLAGVILRPINAIDLDNPATVRGYQEINPLIQRIKQQKEDLNHRIQAMERKSKELATITENMKEGLILLSSDGTVLSINQSARSIFGAISEKSIGRHILSLCRNEVFQEVITQGHKGKSEERMMTLNNKTYRLAASPISESGGGMALLIFDVTEQVNAEAGRREFTSNVTHELKTPLTSIVGYAEIMQDGLAKPEDMREFAGRIYDEAKRLIAMIEDILRLAKLDEEQKAPPTQRVSLKRLCEEVVQRLHHAASLAKVTLVVEGEETQIEASPQLLEELVYNLVDNAIRYNKTDGNVWVSVEKRSSEAVLKVRDTGIGIPKQEQSKVFERFYRVEKSHAKLIEGTGLGLSIVKHIARRHHAAIELDSQEGLGTEIRIVFPVSN